MKNKDLAILVLVIGILIGIFVGLFAQVFGYIPSSSVWLVVLGGFIAGCFGAGLLIADGLWR